MKNDILPKHIGLKEVSNMQPLHRKTSTLYSLPISQSIGQNIWLKMECEQPTGAYKIRGIGNLCQYYFKQGVKHFVSSSGGNAGVAVAYAGRMLGANVNVFVPESSHLIFINAIKAQGANVHIKGKVWDEAHQHALEFLAQSEGKYIPPFDDPIIWEGYTSMITEAAEAMPKPDALIAAVGGGGLACGILQGMHQHGWQDVPFYSVETDGAASFAKSIKADKLITLDSIDTIATSLGAKRVTSTLWDWTKKHEIIPLTTSDNAAVKAVRQFANDHRVLVEPAAGAVLSIVYDNKVLKAYENVLVIVCGGVGISLDLLNKFEHESQ